MLVVLFNMVTGKFISTQVAHILYVLNNTSLEVKCVYISLKSRTIFHPGYVPITTKGLSLDHQIRTYCSWDPGRFCLSVVLSAVVTLSVEVLEVQSFDALVSHSYFLRALAHLTGCGALGFQFMAIRKPVAHALR